MSKRSWRTAQVLFLLGAVSFAIITANRGGGISFSDGRLGASTAQGTGFAITTYHNDVARTGLNASETILTPQNVNQNTFGKLFSYPVDGQIYAQPLYVENVDIPGKGRHNVVYVATEHDSVYAFDADRQLGTPLWQVSFINPKAGVNTVSTDDVSSSCCITPEIGITGTPAIDLASGTLYVVAATNENGEIVQRLHALDIATGAEKFGGPVEIAATFPGTGLAADGSGKITFDPRRQLQRGALLLHNGLVHVTFGSHGSILPYHGWIMAYDARTLRQVAVWTSTPNGERGSLWHSGGGPAVDAAGNIYAVTANGTFTAAFGGQDYSDSFLRLRLAGNSYIVDDYFTPHNQGTLETLDLDLGSGGPLVLPDQPGPSPPLVVAGSKEGRVYLVNRDNMGKFHAADDSHAVQVLPFLTGAIHSTPAYWNGNLYFAGTNDFLKSFGLAKGRLTDQPTSRSEVRFGFPGASPTVSANGTSNAIVWIIHCQHCGSGNAGGVAVLRAFDATDVSRELYNSLQAGGRDLGGPPVKFAVPTVANGKMYVGTQTQLDVYGLLAQQVP